MCNVRMDTHILLNNYVRTYTTIDAIGPKFRQCEHNAYKMQFRCIKVAMTVHQKFAAKLNEKNMISKKKSYDV